MMKLRTSANRHCVRLVFSFTLLFFCYEAICVQQCGAQESASKKSPIAANEALPHVGWQDADEVVGRIAVVSGKIVNTGSTSNESVNFLNFDTRRGNFTVVIFKVDLKKFSGELKELYQNKLISVRGEVTLYKDVPQIRVRSPEQIRIVKSLPEKRLPKRVRRTPGKQIRVGTFNIRNLFDGVDDPYHLDETTAAKPRREIEKLATTICKIDCDVLALQEVENRGYLQRFVDVFLPKMGYEVVHYSGNDRRGSGLAVLTRVPVGSVTSHRHRRFPAEDGTLRRFSRDLLCVELLPKNRAPFEIWVTHLKSKRGGAEVTEAQRVAEAGEIRRQVDKKLEENSEARVIIVGDFNDTKDSRPLERLVGSGPSKLHTYWNSLPSEAVTYTLEPYRSLIDHMLCTSQAAKGFVKGSYQVTSLTLSTSGSDHNPVTADFQF